MQIDVTAALVEFMGEAVGATTIMGNDDTEPLLGSHCPRSAGIEVAPSNETLKRVPSVRLKGLREK